MTMERDANTSHECNNCITGALYIKHTAFNKGSNITTHYFRSIVVHDNSSFTVHQKGKSVPPALPDSVFGGNDFFRPGVMITCSFRPLTLNALTGRAGH